MVYVSTDTSLSASCQQRAESPTVVVEDEGAVVVQRMAVAFSNPIRFLGNPRIDPAILQDYAEHGS